jgi:hypothetical protein
MPFPGDYRSRNEIRRDFIQNTLEAEGHPEAAKEAIRIMDSGEGPSFVEARGESWDRV